LHPGSILTAREAVNIVLRKSPIVAAARPDINGQAASNIATKLQLGLEHDVHLNQQVSAAEELLLSKWKMTT